MKLFIDIFSALLLLLIAILLFILTKDKIMDQLAMDVTSTTNIANNEGASSKEIPNDAQVSNNTEKRIDDITNIAKYKLSQMYKFPDDIKFEVKNSSYIPFFSSKGFQLPNMNAEIEFAEMCGFFSARNAMGVYGKKELFYSKIVINNFTKDIEGYIIFSTDDAVVESDNFNYDLFKPSDKDKLDLYWSKLCQNSIDEYKGTYLEYNYSNFDNFDEVLFNQSPLVVDDQNFVNNINNCITNNTPLENCVKQLCQQTPNDHLCLEYKHCDKNIPIIDCLNSIYHYALLEKQLNANKLELNHLQLNLTKIQERKKLMWLILPSVDTMVWDKALTYCSDLDFAGFTDWRLPSIDDLSLYYNECPLCMLKRFKDIRLWSSTENKTNPDNSWYFDVSEGKPTADTKGLKLKATCVRNN